MPLLKLDLIIILSLRSLFVPSAAVISITCTMPPVMEKEEATLTCFFHEDIKSGTKHILIRHYPVDSTEPEDLIDYVPAESEECVVHNNQFRCSDKASRNLSVQLLHASKEFEGRYTCDIISSEAREVISCPFYLHQSSESKNDENHEDVYIAAVAAAGVVAAMVIIIVCRLQKKQRRRAQMPKCDEKARDCKNHAPDRKSMNEDAIIKLTSDKMDDGGTDVNVNDNHNGDDNVIIMFKGCPRSKKYNCSVQ